MSTMICVCGYDMQLEIAGIGVDYGNGHVYPGDLWVCQHGCCVEIVHTIGHPVHDENYTQHKFYIYGRSHVAKCETRAPIEKLWIPRKNR